MRLQALLPTLRSRPVDEEKLKQLLNALINLRLALPQDVVLRYSAEQLFHLLPVDCISRKQWNSLYEEITTFLVADVSKGDELYQQELLPRACQSSVCTLGLPSIDSAIDLPQDGVVELAGFAGSGKTVFLNHMVVKYLLDNEERSVMWIDTLGSFSPELASQVVEQLKAKKENDALLRLQVASCPDLASVYDILEGVETQSKDQQIVGPKLRMIVIDPITPLLGPSLSAVSSKGHAMMVTFMRYLMSLAKQYRILVFISNTATRPRPISSASLQDAMKPKPSLGPSFTYLTDVSLFLSKDEQRPGPGSRDFFRLKILKSRGKHSGDVCRFGIQNGCIITGNGRQ
ncbi:hypothetical protein PIIN_09121 [Serendipita indica DSM 11827]|uniref:RecA family profile 1 domain-containing protein n=1 Tax=Serendipita indica (strain DSM 11827) TaxID=1109443 RepID=G4TUY9_SERID|nr:hypothetical protein PIIN_09121 [Serendipita indica DSM 11827]